MDRGDNLQANSMKSQSSKEYWFSGSTGLTRRYVFREEPSILDNPKNSYRILCELAQFMWRYVPTF